MRQRRYHSAKPPTNTRQYVAGLGGSAPTVPHGGCAHARPSTDGTVAGDRKPETAILSVEHLACLSLQAIHRRLGLVERRRRTSCRRPPFSPRYCTCLTTDYSRRHAACRRQYGGGEKEQQGLAVASIARDDPSTLPGDDPFPRARMHRDRNAR